MKVNIRPLKITKRGFIRSFAPPHVESLNPIPEEGKETVLFHYYVDPEVDLLAIVLPGVDHLEVAQTFLEHLKKGGDEWEVLKLLGSSVPLKLSSISTVRITGPIEGFGISEEGDSSLLSEETLNKSVLEISKDKSLKDLLIVRNIDGNRVPFLYRFFSNRVEKITLYRESGVYHLIRVEWDKEVDLTQKTGSLL